MFSTDLEMIVLHLTRQLMVRVAVPTGVNGNHATEDVGAPPWSTKTLQLFMLRSSDKHVSLRQISSTAFVR